MKAIDFLRTARQLRKPILTVNDISKVIDKPAGYTRLFANRLKNKSLIEEVERGKYTLAGTHEYIVASNIVFPSYLSFYTGLRFYNYTTQLPRTVLVACLKSKNEINKSSYKIKFVKLDRKRFFGYKRIEFDNSFIFVAEPEKVIVDSLYLPEYAPVSEVFEAIKEKEFNTETLVKYALKMNSVVLLKRLGYLLEIAGVDIFNSFKKKLNKRIDKLNPYLMASNPNKKWRLYINEVLE